MKKKEQIANLVNKNEEIITQILKKEYQVMIDYYFDKNKDIFYYTDAALELFLLSNDREYRDIVKGFIDDTDDKYTLYNAEYIQNEKTRLTNNLLNESESNNIIKEALKLTNEINNASIITAEIKVRTNMIENAKPLIKNRNFIVWVQDMLINILKYIGWNNIKTNLEVHEEIIKSNTAIIKELELKIIDINTDNLVKNFSKLLLEVAEEPLKDKSKEISNKPDAINKTEKPQQYSSIKQISSNKNKTDNFKKL